VCLSLKEELAEVFTTVCHYIGLYTHYKQILNATLRNILKLNNVIYALYNVLSNWSRGTNSTRHPFFRKNAYK
jgi:hypothetical protein